jgi:FkbM family methyltransferase
MAGVSRKLPGFRGKGRLVRALDACLRRCAAGAHPLSLRVDGTRYELITEDLIDFRTAYLGGHDTLVSQFLDRRIRPPRTVLWDVGANVGSILLPLARRHPELLVEAFEPAPPVVARLRRNVTLNQDLAARIRVHEVALHDRDSVVEFYVSGRASNSGLGSLATADCAARESVRVTARRGDRLIEEKAALVPDLIKLDVEGFEHEVLAGLRGALTARREILIVFEHEPYRLAGRGAGAPAVTLLHGLGFSVFGLRSPAILEPWSDAMLQKRQNLVALREHGR